MELKFVAVVALGGFSRSRLSARVPAAHGPDRWPHRPPTPVCGPTAHGPGPRPHSPSPTARALLRQSRSSRRTERTCPYLRYHYDSYCG
ncbi:unnamed protein product [Danaus chrysippus]|uniref:(African queen) hypothetical protein n=1 Tax=Danaus chrysippus TaxID=151541 RepID=A0A8J2QMJ2_9NEOP|nr:unnamed protein product [Danaus chrysippus]